MVLYDLYETSFSLNLSHHSSVDLLDALELCSSPFALISRQAGPTVSKPAAAQAPAAPVACVNTVPAGAAAEVSPFLLCSQKRARPSFPLLPLPSPEYCPVNAFSCIPAAYLTSSGKINCQSLLSPFFPPHKQGVGTAGMQFSCVSTAERWLHFDYWSFCQLL